MISTLAPARCGIAKYAEQVLRREAGAGAQFKTVSLSDEGLGDIHLDVNSLAAACAFARFVLASRWAAAELQYAPEFFAVSGGRAGRTLKYMVLAAAFFCLRLKARAFRVVVHEYRPGAARSVFGLSFDRLLFRAASQLVLHTAPERRTFLALCGAGFAPKVALRRHEAPFARHFEGTAEEARARAGVAAGETLFLCIGFLAAHKGFEAAIAQFAANAGVARGRLAVVGSGRTDTAAAMQYTLVLHKLARADPERIRLVDRYVDDHEFDMWIAAADHVVLPYRHIWSSGVAGRAMLYGKRIVARDLATLRDQLDGADVTWFESDAELGALFADLSAGRR